MRRGGQARKFRTHFDLVTLRNEDAMGVVVSDNEDGISN